MLSSQRDRLQIYQTGALALFYQESLSPFIHFSPKISKSSLRSANSDKAAPSGSLAVKKESVGKSYATWGRADAGPLRIKSWGPRAHYHPAGGTPASGTTTGSTRATSLLNIFMHSTAGGALEEEQTKNKAAGYN